jgi:hypothetical protein
MKKDNPQIQWSEHPNGQKFKFDNTRIIFQKNENGDGGGTFMFKKLITADDLECDIVKFTQKMMFLSKDLGGLGEVYLRGRIAIVIRELKVSEIAMACMAKAMMWNMEQLHNLREDGKN